MTSKPLWLLRGRETRCHWHQLPPKALCEPHSPPGHEKDDYGNVRIYGAAATLVLAKGSFELISSQSTDISAIHYKCKDIKQWNTSHVNLNIYKTLLLLCKICIDWTLGVLCSPCWRNRILRIRFHFSFQHFSTSINQHPCFQTSFLSVRSERTERLMWLEASPGTAGCCTDSTSLHFPSQQPPLSNLQFAFTIRKSFFLFEIMKPWNIFHLLCACVGLGWEGR